MSSGIEWTDETWNPVTGCDRVSPGCDHCYALTMAARLKGMGSPAYQQDGDPRTSGPGFALQMHPDRLDQPLRWTRPRRIFVNSMSDLFHPKVTDAFIARVFAVMASTPQHTYQVLTKRPKRMRALLGDANGIEGPLGLIEAAPDEDTALAIYTECNPLPNVWLGVSVEDQQRADERIPVLLDTEAAVRFLSCEPLLGRVDIGAAASIWRGATPSYPDNVVAPLHWVIAGGESGPGARPMHPAWARDLRDLCTAAGVPFLFKQWGAWAPVNEVYDEDFDVGDLLGRHVAAVELSGDVPQEHWADDLTYRVDHQSAPGSWWMERVGKKAAGRVLDGRTWDEFPETAGVPA